MDTYVGLDGHVSSSTPGVLGPGGKRRGSHVVETNAKALIEVLLLVPRLPRRLCRAVRNRFPRLRSNASRSGVSRVGGGVGIRTLQDGSASGISRMTDEQRANMVSVEGGRGIGETLGSGSELVHDQTLTMEG